MRTLFFVFLLTALLLPFGLLAAEALPQPDAQDWKDLEATAQRTSRRYKDMVNDASERVKNITSELKNNTSNNGETALVLAHYQALKERCEQAVASIAGINDDLKALTAAGRTRAEYLQLRLRVKILQVQLEEDERHRYYRGIDEYGGAISLESRLDALKKNPPETIPIGPKPTGLTLDWSSLPRLDGSTTAQPLETLITCRLLGLSATWQYRHIYDSSMEMESPERILIPQCSGSPLVAEAGNGDNMSANATFPGLRLSLPLTGTNKAYNNLIFGTCDFIIVARPPSEDERELAKKRGVELESKPIAYDAFIFILNSQNPVSSLTVQQIQDIYQDKVLRWSEVGGNDDKLVAYQRERNSGSQETMQALVMKELDMAPSVQHLLEQGMGGPYNRLTGDKKGIGYTFYYYHNVQSPVNRALFARPGEKPVPPIKTCAVNGVMPTPETIRDHSYPFYTEVYSVIRKGSAKDSPAVRLRDWLLTPEGQDLVQESGYVKL